ncbi:MAG: tetraacyldisaccharide 4'-kinase [Nitrospirales bacterium]|nr:tetraacyldisaccharide 4'-kinase [Nitrospirales bacterium]
MNLYCPWILRVFAVPVRVCTAFRRTAYRRGWFTRHRLPQLVISVGNVTIGGTGKTPFVIWLAHRLHEAGRKVAILSRGYGRSLSSEYLIVSDGQRLQTSWQLSGDEPFLIAQKCPWAIVAVGNDRYELGRWVNTRCACDCFILDDGFQHLHLYRDLDFVLLDAGDHEGIKRVFPAGRLRESLHSLRDATSIVLTRIEGELHSVPILKKLEDTLGLAVRPISVKFRLSSCRHLGKGIQQAMAMFQKQSVLAFSGIGNGEAFLDDLKSLDIEVVEEIRFQDHFSYSAKDMDDIRKIMKDKHISCALTTEKDAVKIREWVRPDDSIWAVTLDVQLCQGEDEITNILSRFPARLKG